MCVCVVVVGVVVVGGGGVVVVAVVDGYVLLSVWCCLFVIWFLFVCDGFLWGRLGGVGNVWVFWFYVLELSICSSYYK